MSEPARTRHEKMVGHLRAQTRHLEKVQRLAQEAAQRHLEQNPGVAPAPSNTDTPPAKEAIT